MSIESLENHKQKLMSNHRTLDKKIIDLFRKHYGNDQQITNLKKQKLVLKQEIVDLEDQIYELQNEEMQNG